VDPEVQDAPARQVAGQFELSRREVCESFAQLLLLGIDIRETPSRLRITGFDLHARV
jgi:hypothetical protein